MKLFLQKLRQKILIARYQWSNLKNKSLQETFSTISILTDEETVRRIVEERLSVSRFGDGEFDVMAGGSNGFQRQDERLGKRLREVIMTPLSNLLVCIPYSFKSQKKLTSDSKLFALGFLNENFERAIKPFLKEGKVYGDSLFTRFYMGRNDKRRTADYVKLLQKLWEGEDLLIVEGCQSRLGVGNDLFSNVRSIKRILCPACNAFDKYDEILATTQSHSAGRLVVLALGMTATVLAYDLAKQGIRALDLGHIDVEYEWYRMGATHKVPLVGKKVNEARGEVEGVLNFNESEVVACIK